MITSMNGFNEAAVARVTAEADANARLIVDLLAALKALLAASDHTLPETWRRDRPVSLARAAIARAETW